MQTQDAKIRSEQTVNLMLTGGRVTKSFRDQLFSLANKAGVSVNEFVLTAAAEKIRTSGEVHVSGLFRPGDLRTGG